MISEFYAVTMTSLYHVKEKGEDDKPEVRKILKKDKSRVRIGQKLTGGTMVGICKWLMVYIPEGHGWLSPQTSYERKIEKVNTQWWRGHTSSIVALFMDKTKAEECLASNDLKPCDPRWIEETKIVLDAIGDNHPVFEICHWPGLALIPV